MNNLLKIVYVLSAAWLTASEFTPTPGEMRLNASKYFRITKDPLENKITQVGIICERVKDTSWELSMIRTLESTNPPRTSLLVTHYSGLPFASIQDNDKIKIWVDGEMITGRWAKHSILHMDTQGGKDEGWIKADDSFVSWLASATNTVVFRFEGIFEDFKLSPVELRRLRIFNQVYIQGKSAEHRRDPVAKTPKR